MKVSGPGEQVEHDLPRRDGGSLARKLENGSPVREGHQFLSTADAATRAHVVGGLQGSLGNSAVQRLAGSQQKPTIQRAPQTGSEPVVQRAMAAEFKVEHTLITNPIVAETYNMGASGAGGKEAQASDVSFTKKLDGNTPGLMDALVRKTAIPKVELDLSKTETSEGKETKTPILGYVFEAAKVTSVQHGGSKEDATESVSISYQKMTIKSPESGKGMQHDFRGAEAEQPKPKEKSE